MGIHTLRCKSGKKVRDVLLDGKATEKAKNSPRGTRRRIKIILTRKQLELLLLNSAEGVSSKLPKTYGCCKRKWKPSLRTIVEVDKLIMSLLFILSFCTSLNLHVACSRVSRSERILITTPSSSWIFPCQSCVQKKDLVISAFIIVLSFNISLSLDQQEMEIQARLMEYKFHVMITIIVIVVLSSLVYAAPRILDILAYFWPLFASTAAFLAMAIISGGFQQLSDEATGEGIMDYVAGRPEDSYKYN
ncbi:hypothetical protein DY000_02026655 [Brassica cretica]|uniref:Uncharacterized protein n=1 Tax=Brassica cretica TaxID=69181 RepID=A0ABQ7ED35_BRACR|nr:hypothetical protein DY000_02026655 [Brassica cretica]